MTSIKRTGAQPPPTSTQRRNVSSCGPATPTERAVSSCGGWVSKSTRSKTEKAEKTEKKSNTAVGCGWGSPKRNTATVSSCGGAGWSRYGKIPSGC
jgi:hypothetical protein